MARRAIRFSLLALLINTAYCRTTVRREADLKIASSLSGLSKDDSGKQSGDKETSECQDALGMASGKITDGQVTASSEYSSHYAAKNGRLQIGTAWSADTNDANQWMQIDLGVDYPTVTRVVTQGSSEFSEWVTEYKLQYSNDGGKFQYYAEGGQVTDKVFAGNADMNTAVSRVLNPPIKARYIRFRPIAWSSWISMRVELFGCPPQDGPLKPDFCFFVLQADGTHKWKCKERGAPDSSLTEIDLLGTIGEPLPLGVSLTKGPHTTPAFHFRSIANVGRFARYIFPKQFFKEFSITVAIRPKRAEHGVIFAILPHYRRGDVILGLEIRSASFSEGTTVSLIRASNGKTKTVFEFTVPDITGKWTRLAFSVRQDGVTFYHDCKEIETKFGPLGDLTLPSYSALYIGRAGWTPGAQSSTFEGDIAELAMHKDPSQAKHQECKAGIYSNNEAPFDIYNITNAYDAFARA
ncbi:hypothetical protein ACROYT_G035929 [Oculina patagonica]